MLTKALSGVLILMGALGRATYAAELSELEVLKKVEATYQNLRSCQFKAVSEVGVEELNQINPTGGADEDSPNHAYYRTKQAVTSHIELATVSPGKVRLSVTFEGASPGVFHDDFLVVSDGQTTWAYMPKDKKYTEETAPPSSSQPASQLAVFDIIRQYWTMLVGRFRSVARFSPAAELEKTGQLKIGRQKIECYVIKVEMKGVMDEMWVDKDRFIVWRLKQTPRVKAPQGTTRQAAVTLNVTEVELNPQMEDGIFKFTPPEKASKVASLPWPVKSE